MAEEDPAIPAEPVVEGDAVELPFAVADEPIAVATSRPGPDPVSRLGNAAEAFATGHADTPAPSWQEPLMELAHEKPELVVAGAFAGGLLFAMILRRLGN
jgi:hypothetical protein